VVLPAKLLCSSVRRLMESFDMDPDEILDMAPDEILESSDIMAMDFHPVADLLALGLITGEIKIYHYSPQSNALVHQIRAHEESCRSLQFSVDGLLLFSGSSDHSLRVFDTRTWQMLHVVESAHNTAVNVLSRIGDVQLASGDDDGVIKLWDARQPDQATVVWSKHSDYISALLPVESGRLLSASGDGRLGVWQSRSAKMEAMSDERDDELLSLALIKEGRKLLVGTASGHLLVWSWGKWADISDSYAGHPESVEQLIPLDPDSVVTASSDGMLRVVGLQPNRLIGMLGVHGEFPVELLRRSRDDQFLASASHDQSVKFWDLHYLVAPDQPKPMDDDDDDDAPAVAIVDGAAVSAPPRAAGSRRGFFGGLL